MTTSRSRRFQALLAVVLAAAACTEVDRTEPVSNLIASDLQGEPLLNAFSSRIVHLSDDKEKFAEELRTAGFQLRPWTPTSSCGSWEYPVSEDAPETAVRAFVMFCDEGSEPLELRRLGIRRGPMTYD